MAAIKISSIKTSMAYTSIEARASNVQCLTSSNHSGSLSAYPNQITANGNLISGQIVSATINDNLPKPKIRIHKKQHQNNMPLVNLDENLFARNGNNFVTTKSIIDEANSQKIERNYSYIEAMKEDIPFQVSKPSKVNRKGDTLPNSLNVNRMDFPMSKNGFPCSGDTKWKPPLSIPSSSPTISSPASSTKSSTASQKNRANYVSIFIYVLMY